MSCACNAVRPTPTRRHSTVGVTRSCTTPLAPRGVGSSDAHGFDRRHARGHARRAYPPRRRLVRELPRVGPVGRFVARDLVTEIDRRYRTIANRQARGIAGQSMGGYGALWIALRRREVFGVVSAMSPVGQRERRPHWRRIRERSTGRRCQPGSSGRKPSHSRPSRSERHRTRRSRTGWQGTRWSWSRRFGNGGARGPCSARWTEEDRGASVGPQQEHADNDVAGPGGPAVGVRGRRGSMPCATRPSC